jgi:hypothetical protein
MIADNVKNDTSLLLLRNKLRDDKGVDWRQFFDAFTRARNEYGFQPSVNQLQEMTELINPPRDSLVDIFSQPGKGWSRFIDWQRGAK